MLLGTYYIASRWDLFSTMVDHSYFTSNTISYNNERKKKMNVEKL